MLFMRVSASWCCGTLTFCWQGRGKTCVVPSCYDTAMSKGEGYSACGNQQGAGRGGPDVWTPQSDASTVALDGMTYPWGRTLVWHSIHWCLWVCLFVSVFLVYMWLRETEPGTKVWLKTKVSLSLCEVIECPFLNLLYLMNSSTQDTIREGDCFLSAISTEYTV